MDLMLVHLLHHFLSWLEIYKKTIKRTTKFENEMCVCVCLNYSQKV